MHERKNDPSLEAVEVKTAVQSLMKSFEDFKSVNDERLKQVEKGREDVVTKEALARLEKTMQEKEDSVKSTIAAVEAKAARAGMNAEEGAASAAEKKSAAEMAFLCGRADLSVDEAKSYKSALDAHMRKGGAISTDEQKALSVGSNPDGGYLVHPDMSGRIIKAVYESSPMRQFANIKTISTDALTGLHDLDEAGAGWIGETDDRTETTTPKTGEWRIPVHELYAEPRATQKMLDDSVVDIEAWLAEKVADRFSRRENDAFFNGDGAKKPRGILTYGAGTPSASAFNVIEQVVSGKSGAFADTNPADSLINLVFALKNAYRERAVFMMRRSTLAEVRKLKDGNGQYLWQPDFTQKQNGQLLGYAVAEAEDMPQLAANSLSIAFGNFDAGYQIVDRVGLRILRDNYTAKPYVKFYTTKRVGGDVVNFEAIKLMKFAAA